MDIVLDNVSILDFNKKKATDGGLVIVDKHIVDIYYGKASNLSDKARIVIDGKGKPVLPGFWDVHSRADLACISDPSRASAVSQGVTVEVLGNDGFSIAPVSSKNYLLHTQYVTPYLGNNHIKWKWESLTEYLSFLNKKIATNTLYYLPYGTLRMEATISPVLSNEAIASLKNMLEKYMDEGGIGLSISVNRSPSSLGWSNNEEIKPLLDILRKKNGILNVSLDNAENVVSSIDKAITLANLFNLRLHISRLSYKNHEQCEAIYSLLEKRAKELEQILVDVSPYSCKLFKITELVHEFVKSGLEDSQSKKSFVDEIITSHPSESLNLMKFVSSADPELKQYEGLTLEEIAKKKKEDTASILLYLLKKDSEKILIEKEIVDKKCFTKLFSLPYVLPATTGLAGGRPVPDIYGAFTKYLEDFSKVDLFETAKKLSLLPADFYNFKWGVKKGLPAHLLVLDTDHVKSNSSFVSPTHLSDGVLLTVINGKICWDKGKATGEKSGQVLSWI